MATQPYIVIRLVPESPVDGATFGTYLDGLQLQVFDANTGEPLSDFVYSSPLILFQWFPLGPGYLGVVSAPTSASTEFVGKNNYGQTLEFDSTDGISAGSFVFSSDGTTIPSSSRLQVVELIAATSQPSALGKVRLSGTLPNYVSAGTVVSFIAQSTGEDPTSPPAFSFPLTTSVPATTIDGKTTPAPNNPLLVLHFADTAGVTVGMELSPIPGLVTPGTTVAAVTPAMGPALGTVTVSQTLNGSPTSVTFNLNPPFAWLPLDPSSATHPTTLDFDGTGPKSANGVATGMTLIPITGLVAPGTTVTDVITNQTPNQVKLSRALLGPMPPGQVITFTFPLSSGIVQHVDPLPFGGFFELANLIVPASVATAVIPLNLTTAPDYLDITINAQRGSEVIPINNTFYNVLVSTDELPSMPSQYQNISISNTSLYIALPPQPGTTPISLVIPSDGSAPPFDALYAAVRTALTNDPVVGAVTAANLASLISHLIGDPNECRRIAYDIVWSYQNTLPLPPDPLESLYTNPPNPGGSTSSNNSTSNLEQDRQKFEGTLNSFYSSRNATAERLTKFVAAVSAAVFCEQTSLNSTTALLEFPVDPASSFAALGRK